MSELQIKPVDNVFDALQIAEVRNSGREFMTHDQHEISQEEQVVWFTNTYLLENEAGNLFAFCGYEGGVSVAYGLVKRDFHDDFWLTGVVRPEAQGRGYGFELFDFLTDFALDRVDCVYLDVLRSNEKAQALYRKLGFQALDSEAEIIVMRKTK